MTLHMLGVLMGSRAIFCEIGVGSWNQRYVQLGPAHSS